MACDKFSQNSKNCTCSYAGCSRKGKCCECVAYHARMREIPGCFFDKEGERTYDRSIENFIKSQKTGAKA